MPRATPRNDEDPVVREIRAIRARFWKQGGETGAGYLALMEDIASQRKRRQRAKSSPGASSRRRPKRAG